MSTNNFLPFCPTDTGTNLLDQTDYAAATDRTIGNQPGVASSKLVNKAIRQSSAVVSQLAQYMANTSGANILDDGVSATLLAQITGIFGSVLPVFQSFTASGSNTYNITYSFAISSGSATVGATYTNNGNTYTVVTTVASTTQVYLRGNADPTASGTLTKASGTGDATLSFFIVRKPRWLEIKMVGGGGGGGSSGQSGWGAATNGGDTTWASTVLVAGGGGLGGQASGGTGGTSSIGTGPTGIALTGGNGQGYQITGTAPTTAATTSNFGASGAASAFGGGGGGGSNTSAGQAAAANTGGGGGGAAPSNTVANNYGGGGGGSGGYISAILYNPSTTYSLSVGVGGTHGGSGVNGVNGGNGGSGLITVIEHY